MTTGRRGFATGLAACTALGTLAPRAVHAGVEHAWMYEPELASPPPLPDDRIIFTRRDVRLAAAHHRWDIDRFNAMLAHGQRLIREPYALAWRWVEGAWRFLRRVARLSPADRAVMWGYGVSAWAPEPDRSPALETWFGKYRDDSFDALLGNVSILAERFRRQDVKIYLRLWVDGPNYHHPKRSIHLKAHFVEDERPLHRRAETVMHEMMHWLYRRGSEGPRDWGNPQLCGEHRCRRRAEGRALGEAATRAHPEPPTTPPEHNIDSLRYFIANYARQFNDRGGRIEDWVHGRVRAWPTDKYVDLTRLDVRNEGYGEAIPCWCAPFPKGSDRWRPNPMGPAPVSAVPAALLPPGADP